MCLQREDLAIFVREEKVCTHSSRIYCGNENLLYVLEESGSKFCFYCCEDERQEPRHPMTRNKVVGADLAYHSSQGMAVLLGQAADANVPADQLTMILSRKTRSELYEYLSQMQAMLRQNPEQARQTLVENPQLTRALFLMEIILGMVNNPLGDIAPKGIAHPGMLPPKFDGMSSMDQSNVQPGRLGANGIPRPAAPTGPLPYNPMHGAYPVDSTSAPLAASAVADPRLVSGGPPGDPRRQHYPISGPAPMAPTPRPMVAASFNTQQPTLSNLTQSTLPSIPGMTPEQQQGKSICLA